MSCKRRFEALEAEHRSIIPQGLVGAEREWGAEDERASRRVARVGVALYGRVEAGGTHVLHVLPRSPGEHSMPAIGPERYPRHHIPLWQKIRGPLTLTGGASGKWRAVKNALTKPWRLRYRYWHRPDEPIVLRH